MMPINRPVRAVTRDGKVINGRRLNEDTYTVQLLDDQEKLVSLTKADLREFTILTVSPMPSYRNTLTDAELADVVAYLLSLKGR
jgi:mono/diheme cytochrome c family protein